MKLQSICFPIKNDLTQLQLTGFDLATRYTNEASGRHIEPINMKAFEGNLKFASVHSLQGYKKSRRDDYESIFYILVFLLNGRLPWSDIKLKREATESQMTVLNQRLTMSRFDLLSEMLPERLRENLKNCYGLTFAEKPNYAALRLSLLFCLYKGKQNQIPTPLEPSYPQQVDVKKIYRIVVGASCSGNSLGNDTDQN